MHNNPLAPDSSKGAQLNPTVAQALHLPERQKSASVICLTEHEVDVAQDLIVFVQKAVSWQPDKQGPSVSTLEKIEYLLDIAATLYAVGAPPRLVAEALLHPAVSGEDFVASPEERREQFVGYLAMRFKARPFLAVENSLSRVPAGSISYELPASFARGQRTWSDIKQEILTPTLDTLKSAPDFVPVYSDDQLAFMREGVRMALQQLSSPHFEQDSDLKAGQGAWDTLYHRLDIGLLLLSTKKSPEVVVAGLLHDLQEKSSSVVWSEERRRIELFFGPRVRELIELTGFDPAALPSRGAADITVFEQPLLLAGARDCKAELRPDLETLIASKSVSFLARNLIETVPLARAVSIPMRGVPDLLVTGLKDWGELRWTEQLAIFSSYCDCIYEQKTLRPIFDRTIRSWAKAPKFLPGTIALMTARKAFEELFPRSQEAAQARLDSMNLVREVMRTALGAGEQPSVTASLLLSYIKHSGNVARLKEVQTKMEKFEEDLFADQSRAPHIAMQMRPAEYTDLERNLIARAVDYIADFFCRENLRDMSRDPVDQMKHSCEVGFVLMRVGVKADVIIAALLHDVYELTPKNEVPQIRREVVGLFADLGKRIDNLIYMVTEPPKDPRIPGENYIIRKSEIIEKLAALNTSDSALARDAATVVCAAKMSTMKDGYHFASDFAKVQPWTKGSWSENVRAMCGLHDMFERFGILPQLLGAYREELRSWVEVTRHMHPSLLDDALETQSLREARGKSELDSKLKALLHTVQSFHRTAIRHQGNDIRSLVSQATEVTNEIPQYAIPADAQNATDGEVVTFLNEVGRLVFLPQGIYLFNRIAGDLCEIVSGVVSDTARCRRSYLGKDFAIFDIRFQHGLNNLRDVSATIDGQIFIDRVLSALHGRRIIENVESRARQGNKTAIRLAETIIKHRISPEQFERVQGYERHLFQQLACAEDSRYLELLAGPEDFRFNDIRYAKALMKSGDLSNRIARFEPELGLFLLRQYAVVFGGLTKQLDFYVSNQDLVNAKVCMLTAYFNFQDTISKAHTSQVALPYNIPAELFVRKMDQKRISQLLESDLLFSEDWEGELCKVVDAVRHAYFEDFFSELERIVKIRTTDVARGRPSSLSY